MNFLLPFSWLKEYLKTASSAETTAKYLSLCGVSIERINDIEGEKVFDIEITTNRVDTASVIGTAREAGAILPQHQISAKFQKPNFKIKEALPLKELRVEITNPELCPRFSAFLVKNVRVKPSPKNIQHRLELSGVRPLSNIVDITNYVMLETGSPMHAFDFDQILNQKMILRESRNGEKITTLDGVTRNLPGGAIVIEDGSGRLIDLCGIMGAENSAISEKTTKVLFFAQVYHSLRLRKTSQLVNLRTSASTLFEKGIDPEGVLQALNRSIILLEQEQKIQKIGFVDIYPKPAKPKFVSVDTTTVEEKIGVKIPAKQQKEILTRLGFEVSEKDSLLTAKVPSFRHRDVTLAEDLVEEIARIYGYFNLPGVMPTGPLPADGDDRSFVLEREIKRALSGWGLTEVYTFSLVEKSQSGQAVEILNPLTQDMKFLRAAILPSHLEIIAANQAHCETLEIFELANIYLNKGEELPAENLKLAITLAGANFYKLKGLIEQLFEMNGWSFRIQPFQNENFTHEFVEILNEAQKPVGYFGKVKPVKLFSSNIKLPVVHAEIDFESLKGLETQSKVFIPLPKYPEVIEDVTVILRGKILYQEIIDAVKSASPLIKNVDFKDQYRNSLTLRVKYQSEEKTLTDEETVKVRKLIFENIEKLGLIIKS